MEISYDFGMGFLIGVLFNILTIETAKWYRKKQVVSNE